MMLIRDDAFKIKPFFMLRYLLEVECYLTFTFKKFGLLLRWRLKILSVCYHVTCHLIHGSQGLILFLTPSGNNYVSRF